MQYHIFEINPFNQPRYLQSFPDYRSAKAEVRDLRRRAQGQDRGQGQGGTGGESPQGFTYRMMFAANPELAERLLKEKREPRPQGEHD